MWRTPTLYQAKKGKGNLAPWHNTENEYIKQLDYIRIRKKQTDRATQVKTKGTANIDGRRNRRL